MKNPTDRQKIHEELYLSRKILEEIRQSSNWSELRLRKILLKYPGENGNLLSKDRLIAGYRHLVKTGAIQHDDTLLSRIVMKKIRTLSGIASVTVLTKPYPCPGKCLYCPNEADLPKSYIASEPGAQRAITNKFDPYLQTYNRLLALYNTGHNTEKIEMIIIGGTWSHYPQSYQIWFVTECFRALNEFEPAETTVQQHKTHGKPLNHKESATWTQLEAQQKKNESAHSRCIGLSFETRPDSITTKEIIRLRKLGGTKIQIGVQSLNDKILKLNNRGHLSKQTRTAFKLLRLAGFKIHAHWMVNLHGSSPKTEIPHYTKLWSKDFRPDELKIYPTAIIKSAELHNLYTSGKFTPYSTETLKNILKEMLLETPRYCRINRIIRDIPSQEIVAGNKTTNLRQIVEKELIEENTPCQCIRCREIRDENLDKKKIVLEHIQYSTSTGSEIFISYKTAGKDKIVAFLRLSIPDKNITHIHFIPELRNCAIIREIHVYGQVATLGSRNSTKAQHRGYGTKLISIAKEIASNEGFEKLAVISAVGTRNYYSNRGFKKNNLYMTIQTQESN